MRVVQGGENGRASSRVAVTSPHSHGAVLFRVVPLVDHVDRWDTDVPTASAPFSGAPVAARLGWHGVGYHAAKVAEVFLLRGALRNPGTPTSCDTSLSRDGAASDLQWALGHWCPNHECPNERRPDMRWGAVGGIHFSASGHTIAQLPMVVKAPAFVSLGKSVSRIGRILGKSCI